VCFLPHNFLGLAVHQARIRPNCDDRKPPDIKVEFSGAFGRNV
jgi:hypothetical protein